LPKATLNGASSGYAIGDRATLTFLVGCHSHFDQVYEGKAGAPR
jgi:hypothetical protein